MRFTDDVKCADGFLMRTTQSRNTKRSREPNVSKSTVFSFFENGLLDNTRSPQDQKLQGSRIELPVRVQSDREFTKARNIVEQPNLQTKDRANPQLSQEPAGR